MAPTTDVPAAPKTADVIEPPPTINPRDAALVFAFTKAIADHTAARMKILRENASEVFLPEDKLPVYSPIDRRKKLALVIATDPADVAKFIDRAAFDEWFFEKHDGRCEDVDKLVGSPSQIAAALREYAPADVVDQLVTIDRIIPEHEAKRVLTLSAGVGKPIGPDGEIDESAPPGIEVTTPEPTIQVRLTEGAVEHVIDLWRQNIIDPIGVPAAVEQ